MNTITIAAHVEAYLDPMTGAGLLVIPHPEDLDPGFDALVTTMEEIEARKQVARDSGVRPHETDWSYAIAELDRLGYEPAEAEDGDICYGGDTLDGRSVFGLYGREPITSMPSPGECAEAFRELESMADVVPGSWRA